MDEDDWIPVYVQPPNHPEQAEYMGDAPINSTEQRIAELICLPGERIVEAKVINRDPKPGSNRETRWVVAVI